MKSALLFTTLLAGMALSAGAQAVTVTTAGNLTGLVNCTNPSTCTLSPNQLLWGRDNGFQSVSFANSSSLTTFDGTFALDGDNVDVTLGTLTWLNRATTDSQTDDSFNVTWTLNDTFAAPAGSGSSSMGLNIQNTDNPSGDLIVGFNPGSFTGNIPGYTLTNLEIVVNGGSSSYNSATGRWTNAEGNTSTLTLRGDLVANVPEPMTMSILGMGLIGLSAIRFRRRTGGQPTA